MSGDTWVAVDGSDPDVFTTVSCWISDVGAYVGTVPIPELPDTSFVPDDASKVVFLIVPPNPDGFDDHALGTGGYAYTVTNPFEQDYVPPSTVNVIGDPATPDSGARLFVAWFSLSAPATVGDLPMLDVLPLDLAPYGWVTGARLGAPDGSSDDPETGADGGAPADPDAVSFTLHDVDGSLIGTLADVQGGSWQHELSAPGALSCRVAEDDALYSSLTPKRIIKAWWRGAPRMAARIDSSAVDQAVDGRRWREFGNMPGALSMLADGIVYPEYGADRSSSGHRWFGYMSMAMPADSGNFTDALGYDYNSDTSHKAGKPEGLSFPNPWWIAKNGADHGEASGATQIFRKRFTTSATMTYQILATADNYLTLWLDGEQLYESDRQTALEWATLQQITGTLGAGTHLLAARVVNGRGFFTNPVGLILTLQRMQVTGDVYDEAPVVNTNASWKVADNGPGYRRGDVIATVFDEARARGVAAFTTFARGFTHTLDSNGDEWTDDPGEYGVDVQSTVLDAVTQLAEKDVDVDVDFDTLTLQVFNRLGSDLSGTVALVVGESVTQQRVERVEAKFNTALVQKSDGSYAEKADSASVSAYGRIETGLQLGSTSQDSTVTAVTAAAFTENADTSFTFTVEVSTLAGPQPYVDFNVGDTIGLTDDEGTSRKVRVLAITVDVSKVPAAVTLEVTVDRS